MTNDQLLHDRALKLLGRAPRSSEDYLRALCAAEAEFLRADNARTAISRRPSPDSVHETAAAILADHNRNVMDLDSKSLVALYAVVDKALTAPVI